MDPEIIDSSFSVFFLLDSNDLSSSHARAGFHLNNHDPNNPRTSLHATGFPPGFALELKKQKDSKFSNLSLGLGVKSPSQV